MSTISRIACLGALALAAAACGHSTPTSYNGEVQHNFISACTNAGAPEQACTAAYNCISSRLTFAQFLAADKAAREHTAVDPNTQAVITNCVAESR